MSDNKFVAPAVRDTLSSGHERRFVVNGTEMNGIQHVAYDRETDMLRAHYMDTMGDESTHTWVLDAARLPPRAPAGRHTVEPAGRLRGESDAVAAGDHDGRFVRLATVPPATAPTRIVSCGCGDGARTDGCCD